MIRKRNYKQGKKGKESREHNVSLSIGQVPDRISLGYCKTGTEITLNKMFLNY